MANIWKKKSISILAGNLNSGRSYFLTTVINLVSNSELPDNSKYFCTDQYVHHHQVQLYHLIIGIWCNFVIERIEVVNSFPIKKPKGFNWTLAFDVDISSLHYSVTTKFCQFQEGFRIVADLNSSHVSFAL